MSNSWALLIILCILDFNFVALVKRLRFILQPFSALCKILLTLFKYLFSIRVFYLCTCINLGFECYVNTLAKSSLCSDYALVTSFSTRTVVRVSYDDKTLANRLLQLQCVVSGVILCFVTTLSYIKSVHVVISEAMS